MIVFDLACGCGCQFEGWFASRAEFLSQQERQLLSCPRCGSRQVKKILSPVTHAGSRRTSLARSTEQGEQDQQAEQLLQRLVHALSDYVTREYEDVGTDLASEALKMHYGVGEPRRIRGVASETEEAMLKKEGVELLKVPIAVKAEPEVN